MFTKKNLYYLLVLVLVGASAFFFFNNKNGNYETYNVQIKDFSETVEISGKIIPSQDLDLSFEVVGKIDQINIDTGDFVKAGDILVLLDSSEILSELSEVSANLDKEIYRLAEVSGNTTSQNELQNSAETLLSTIKKSYVTSDDIIKNIVDTFFEDPNSISPDFSSVLGNFFLRQEINEQRLEIGDLLKDWNNTISILDTILISNSDAVNTIENLKKVEEFLTLISSEVDDYSPNSSITQSQIDSYISNISNSRKDISSLIIEINNTYNDFRNIQAEVPVIKASVENARASVSKLSARKDKYVLRAPFDGVITNQDIEVGQVVSASEIIVSMISEDAFEVEGFIPELNIVGVDVGDRAVMQLDAFGKDIKFNGDVSHVDPRETVKDGVTTYRILLNLFDSIKDIRSGMTVDIEIEKELIQDQIIIPRYLIIENKDGFSVELYKDGENQSTEVTVGKSDGSGNVIMSGLSEGDKVIIPE